MSEQEVDQVCQVAKVEMMREEAALGVASIDGLIEQRGHDGMEHGSAVNADTVMRREKLPDGQQHLCPSVQRGLAPPLAIVIVPLRPHHHVSHENETRAQSLSIDQEGPFGLRLERIDEHRAGWD